MTTCEGNAQKLLEIFKKVVPSDDATRSERYLKAVRTITPGKQRRVEELMNEILVNLQLLHFWDYFGTRAEEMAFADLGIAIEQVASVPPSLPEDNAGQYAHFGSGSMQVNNGSGVQNSYSNNGNNGRHFHGTNMYFSGGMD
ncbi:hypothetical protein K431DRAFT_288075 [Polychaeton citri CBS 116435]|uniref:NACHT-NTPase and P-loop NTPases N-terminal domain-containing protein n=1 Tax=Polychaeton citri CBS 116435 TaxID=1314669 RepID=A0A9P4Q4T6_9PEZI|nr:hypothetical protein K431DRAFT_288075 [Polychaeton citri CBS 116435]